MKTIIIIGLFLFLAGSMVFAQSHHTKDGFHNPYSGFENRGMGDVFKWAVIDRLAGKKPFHPDAYSFPLEENDGKWLRQNDSTFSITWVGHSTLLIQVEGLNILTDPIWSDRASPLSFAGPKRYMPPGLLFEDLPNIDVVLISHDHYDHLDKETLLKLGNKPLYLVPLGIGELLQDWGITHFAELDWWGSNRVNGIELICLPAQHFSGRTLTDRDQRLWASWLVKGKTLKIYFGGDSGYFPGYKEIGTKYGPIDFAALPIGAYKPRWFMAPVHMGPKEALQAMADLRANTFVPIHWGTFDLADEPLDDPPQYLRELIKEKQLDAQRFWFFKHGETRTK